MRTADDLALYSPSSCFLLFAVDVLEDAKLKARSQYRPFEGELKSSHVSEEGTISKLVSNIKRLCSRGRMSSANTYWSMASRVLPLVSGTKKKVHISDSKQKTAKKV